jgi:hypothetical protein
MFNEETIGLIGDLGDNLEILRLEDIENLKLEISHLTLRGPVPFRTPHQYLGGDDVLRNSSRSPLDHSQKWDSELSLPMGKMECIRKI